VNKFADDPQHAFPGHGQMKPEHPEIARLKREATKLKAERDILKKPRPTSRRNRREIRFHCEAPGDLAGGLVVRGARCVARRLLRLADTTAQSSFSVTLGNEIGKCDPAGSVKQLLTEHYLIEH
jgi:hypothetical protein